MEWTEQFLYDRFMARDRSFDGRFVVGVVSTGIYCLPSCPARRPRRENIRFFRAPDEAAAAGLRACLRCCPDQYYRGEHHDRALIEGLIARVAAAPAEFGDLADLARVAGVGTSKLNALFRLHRHCTPAEFLRRQRVRAACRLLTTTDLRVLNIGFDVGFDSEAAFHRHFLAQTGLTPGGYRALAGSDDFTLRLPAGYRPDAVLAFHGRDRDGVAERGRADGFAKALMIGGRPVVVDVGFGGSADEPVAHCRVDGGPAGRPDMAAVHAVVVRLLGLVIDGAGFEARRSTEPLVAALTEGRVGLRLPMTGSVFEALAWSIIGQQITVSFAVTLRRELIALAGAPHPGGLTAHPDPAAVAALAPEALMARRFSRAKAHYLVELARRIVAGAVEVEAFPDRPADAVALELQAIKGIGPWTANYVMMRGCGFADCVPVGDAGLATALLRFFALPTRPAGPQMAELMAPFAPHRSLASIHLWASLAKTA